MASKIKKALKKIGKAAVIGGGAYLAAKGLKNRKENKLFNLTEGGDKSDMRSYGPFSKGKNPQASPSNYVKSKTVLGRKGINNMDDGNMYQGAKDGGRMGYKSGGKTKPKSIGKALRGGGKVMR